MDIVDVFFPDGKKMKVCSVDSSFFERNILEFRKNKFLNDAFKKIYVEDIGFLGSGNEVIFSDGKKGIALAFSSWAVFPGINGINDKASLEQVRFAYKNTKIRYLDFYEMSPNNLPFFITSKSFFSDYDKTLPVGFLYNIAEKEIFKKTPENKNPYGRDKFPGMEQKTGWFRANVFRPTEKDDGTCVLFANVFAETDNNPPKKITMLGKDVEIGSWTVPIENLNHLTREEFRIRAVGRSQIYFENILKTERYFQKLIPEKMLNVFAEKALGTNNSMKIDVETDPKTGQLLLLQVPIRANSGSFTSGKIVLIADNPSKESYDRFLGRLATQPSLGTPYRQKQQSGREER